MKDQPIDLRSDTVTRPTPGMLDAMLYARVGDDVFGEDPSVNLLEETCAKRFGKEAAVFCPSGTMTNQIGIKALTQPYDEVICFEGSHIYLYEGGGVAGNSGVSFRLLPGDRGRITPAQIIQAINPEDVHFPHTAVVALENTVNKGGGSCYAMEELQEIAQTARGAGLKVHLDGARLFNAIVAYGQPEQEYGAVADTISLCLSKGLGAPVGSVLIGNAGLIKKARRIRKVFGGGMRQAGFLAAAGLYALENHVDRLGDDHRRAQVLARELNAAAFTDHVLPVETNIIIVSLKEGKTNGAVLDRLKDLGLLATGFGPGHIRFVTHLDFSDEGLDRAVAILKAYG